MTNSTLILRSNVTDIDLSPLKLYIQGEVDTTKVGFSDIPSNTFSSVVVQIINQEVD